MKSISRDNCELFFAFSLITVGYQHERIADHNLPVIYWCAGDVHPILILKITAARHIPVYIRNPRLSGFKDQMNQTYRITQCQWLCSMPFQLYPVGELRYRQVIMKLPVIPDTVQQQAVKKHGCLKVLYAVQVAHLKLRGCQLVQALPVITGHG